MSETISGVQVGHSFDVHDEWLMTPPQEWEDRLRAISPIVEQTSHLRFRYRLAAKQWELYQCIPAALLEPYRVEQLTKHWTSLPTHQQKGRQVLCSEYQHYMFRTHRVDARRFWVLQGTAGGTPVSYTEREKALLKMRELPEEPVPMGVLDPAPFDDRAIKAILERDALLKAGDSLDRLARQRSADGQLAEEAEAELDYRKAFLAWIDEATADQVDLMQHIMRHPELSDHLPRATAEQTQILHTWQDDYLRTGIIPGAGRVSTSLVSPRSFR